VRRKLLAALPEESARDAKRVAARFHVDPVPWFRGADEQRLLPDLAAAVWTGRMLRMRYDSWKAVVERRVAPLGLVLKAGVWYLVAASEGAVCTYRVGSILALGVEDERGTPPKRFDLAGHWRRFSRDYEARMQRGTARVRARPAALRSLARLNQATAEAVAKAEPLGNDGWHALTIPIESIEDATRELLRLGPEVEALGPRELRLALKRAVLALSAVYCARTAPRAKS
jgi:predicted DNA-binding transcriptional regulator YafY